nr:nuclease-related domain-containing protein [Rhodococcus sp. (in: high G+C Gram-positive bacteria)]
MNQNWRHAPSPAYQDFKQMVRRYRPSNLIPGLARFSAERYGEGEWSDDERSCPPWGVAAIAREAILYGNEHRHGEVDQGTVARLLLAFNRSHDKIEGAAKILTPMSYEQFPYQESQFEEMSRIYALFEDPTLGPELDWTEVFGMQLNEAVRAALVLRVWVTKNGGRFDASIMDLDHMQEIFDTIAPREQIETFAHVLTATVSQAKSANDAVPSLEPARRRYGFNPLSALPLVDLGQYGIWAPQVMLVDRALYPSNLYYRGIVTWGKRFAEILGTRTEAYVGRQLEVIADERDLHGEITYNEGKNQKKSVDYIWVTPKAVILVEVKSARMTLGARAGDASLATITERYLSKAREQLDTTANLITARTPPFDQFPTDRPIVGLAVTCEPFYLANSTFDEYGKASTIPSMVLSLRELEHWVCRPATEAVDALLAILRDPERRTYSFGIALGALPSVHNPILAEAWKQYDFLEKQIPLSTSDW